MRPCQSLPLRIVPAAMEVVKSDYQRVVQTAKKVRRRTRTILRYLPRLKQTRVAIKRRVSVVTEEKDKTSLRYNVTARNAIEIYDISLLPMMQVNSKC